ncbi:phospholipase A2 homolog otoconin-22-like [Microcaecilia unicolor]|uniref:Phospholipase A2 n=1 Tax=Microcaecilia unicolor TaxID=1415580 RepID=A0A6P7WP55_9AMPH|nr:phospholipase A2 homolog otoconin-22-like [Microcaecilia unicolor]
MANRLFFGLLLAGVIAFVAGTTAQFDEMIRLTTFSYSLANFTNYGCHCGPNTQGMVLDPVDRCCHEHDCCYNEAIMRGCNPTTQIYRFYATEEKIKCIKSRNRCEKLVCECDEEAADCFRKRIENYNLHFLNFTATPACRGPRPFC